MIPYGTPPFLNDRRTAGLSLALRVGDLRGSARFAGFGFDARPPYYAGYDARTPRVRRVAPFVPGHHIVLEQ